MTHTVCITGAAGYVGAMLVKQYALRDDVRSIIGIDKEPLPDFLQGEPKLKYLQTNLADAGWEELVRAEAPTVVIHTAWQIREMYGQQQLEWQWNIGGSDRVFDFVFNTASVERFIHFSTVASYGALPTNTLTHRFRESEPFRQTQYLYAEEKRIAEAHLEEKYARAIQTGKTPSVAVLRPAAITGPRGRFMRIRFGLQSTLSGQMKGSFVYRFVSLMVSFVPVTPLWLRQFIHEDDVVGIVERLTFGPSVSGYEVFNICPPGDAVLGADMARAVGKRRLLVYPWMVRIAFFVFWHLTRGTIPTGAGAWRGYSYPIAVDGSKVTQQLGYTYAHSSLDAFYYTNGAYERFVPESSRRTKEI